MIGFVLLIRFEDSSTKILMYSLFGKIFFLMLSLLILVMLFQLVLTAFICECHLHLSWVFYFSFVYIYECAITVCSNHYLYILIENNNTEIEILSNLAHKGRTHFSLQTLNRTKLRFIALHIIANCCPIY